MIAALAAVVLAAAPQFTVMTFWSTNCGPCVAEIPALNRLVAQSDRSSVRFQAPTFDDRVAVRAFLATHAFAYEVVPDAQETFDRFGVDGWPTHVVLDSQGRRVATYVGTEQVAERLRALLAFARASAGPLDTEGIKEQLRLAWHEVPDSDQLASTLEWIARYGRARGSEYPMVVIARVRLSDGGDATRVLSQSGVLPGGYFVSTLLDFQAVRFRLDGYAPVDVEVSKMKAGRVFNAGDVVLRKLAPVELGAITARVAPATAAVQLYPRASDWYCCTRAFEGLSRTLDDGGVLTAEALSPGPHTVALTHPGYVSWVGTADVRAGQTVDLGQIRLERALTLQVDIRVGDAPVRHQQLDGDTLLELAPEWTVRLNQRGGEVRFRWGCGELDVADLGDQAIERVTGEELDAARDHASPKQGPIRSGHLYLLQRKGKGEPALVQVAIDD